MILKTTVLSALVGNEEAINQHVFDACQAIRSCPGTFEIVRQPVTRSVYVCIGWGGVHFERLFWIWLDKKYEHNCY